MKILIVDDHEDSRMILKSILRSKKHVVAEATNGQEALKMARKSPPDMIISDILMPVMDGFRLCKEWKKDKNLKQIPFVFYTATYTDEKDEELALKLGADRFIVKPMESDVFIKTIQDAFKDAKKGRRKSQAFREERKDAFKLYNERLVKKLEKKMLDLEREITERKQAEEKLWKSEEMYRSLVESSSDHIFLLRPDGTYISSNSRIKQFGLKKNESLAGKHLRDVYPNRVAEIYQQKLEEVLSFGKPCEFEHPMDEPDGHHYHIDTLFPIFKDGKLWAVGGICKSLRNLLNPSEYRTRDILKTPSNKR